MRDFIETAVGFVVFMSVIAGMGVLFTADWRLALTLIIAVTFSSLIFIAPYFRIEH